MKLADAVSHYFSTLPASTQPHIHQELSRFGRKIGWERSVEELRPPEVADYADEVIREGGDIGTRLSAVKEFLTFLTRKNLSSYRLAPHVKIPRANRPVAAKTAPVNNEAIEMTSVGHQALVDELQHLKGQRVHVVEAIRTAAADKDFKENAPLDAAREAQGKMEARIRELEETLRRAVVVENVNGKKGGGARVGCKVLLKEVTSGKEVAYFLVDSSEADPSQNKISVQSPVGAAVVGRRSGDQVEVSAPKGVIRYQVKAVEQ